MWNMFNRFRSPIALAKEGIKRAELDQKQEDKKEKKRTIKLINCLLKERGNLDKHRFNNSYYMIEIADYYRKEGFMVNLETTATVGGYAYLTLMVP